MLYRDYHHDDDDDYIIIIIIIVIIVVELSIVPDAREFLQLRHFELRGHLLRRLWNVTNSVLRAVESSERWALTDCASLASGGQHAALMMRCSSNDGTAAVVR